MCFFYSAAATKASASILSDRLYFLQTGSNRFRATFLRTDAIKLQAESSKLLLMYHDICNGAKHLKLTTPRGGGARIPGKQLARKCIAEWEQIRSSAI
jgi:hypothetical protein